MPNKTVEQEFQDWVTRVYPKALEEETALACLRDAFYSGVFCMLTELPGIPVAFNHWHTECFQYVQKRIITMFETLKKKTEDGS